MTNYIVRHGLAFLIMAAFSFLATAALAQSPKRGGILNYAITTEPPNYDCHGNTNFGVSQAVFAHYSRLLKSEGNWQNLKLAGDVAESWDIAPDQKAFTFKLRKNVKFHDGSPMTSADVRATYERLIKPPPGVLSSTDDSEPLVAGF